MKFSKRERLLIGILFLLIVWLLYFRLLLFPVYEKYSYVNQMLEQTRLEKDEQDLYVGLLGDLEKNYEKLQREEQDFFYQDIDHAFMDRNLQELAGRAGVEIVGMEIKVPVKEKNGEKSASLEGTLEETTIMMELQCSDSRSLIAMVDEIEKQSKSLFITSFQVDSDQGENGEGKVHTGLKGNMEVKYYYVQVQEKK